MYIRIVVYKCNINMSRKLQYFGLSLCVCVVIVYISTSYTSNMGGVPYKSLHEGPAHTIVAKLSGNFSEKSNWDGTMSRDKLYAFYENHKKYVTSRAENTGKSEGENKSIANTENVYTPNYKEERTLNNLSSLATTNLTKRFEEEFTMKEKRHIAFLKVHKAASTTLQIMFFRFGFERNLSFILPVRGNYFSHSVKTHEDIVPPLHGDHYDITCTHGVFSYKIFSSLMPADTVYLAVVRNPYDQFISAVNYYADVYKLRYLMDVPGNRIENLILHPERHDQPLSYTMNSMARDFGFQRHHFFSESNTDAQQYLEKLGDIFDFVLIAEHFDESLILMKRLLNWSFRDILYISKNVRGSEETISERLMNTFRQRNKLDYMLYEFFYNKFKTALNETGESVKTETDHFKSVLGTVQNWCLDSPNGELIIKASEWSQEFVISTKDCQLMTKHELKFIKILKGETNGI